jgi:hypothetical protein
MDHTTSSPHLRFGLACALTLGLATGAAQAQNLSPNTNRDTWTENTRTQIWKNAYGECWRNMYGPPPGYSECNPAPVAQYVPPAPAPAPAPAPYVAPPPPAYVAPAPAPVIEPAPLPRKKDRN